MDQIDDSDVATVRILTDAELERFQAKRRSEREHAHSTPKWVAMLRRENKERAGFEQLSLEEWRELLTTRNVTSTNHDTVLSIDWPHYCRSASKSCGGSNGWCYTFFGPQASLAHIRKVAMVDVLATTFPEYFAEAVVREVNVAVSGGRLSYPNIRYSGSGEVTTAHVTALSIIQRSGVALWGFTRDVSVAVALREAGIAVIYSYDHSTNRDELHRATSERLRLAYTSRGVDDPPPIESFVVFPLHRSGRVNEVVDSPGLCPKVVIEYLRQERPQGTCQSVCMRCHAS
jgi:hypothetical protein